MENPLIDARIFMVTQKYKDLKPRIGEWLKGYLKNYNGETLFYFDDGTNHISAKCITTAKGDLPSVVENYAYEFEKRSRCELEVKEEVIITSRINKKSET